MRHLKNRDWSGFSYVWGLTGFAVVGRSSNFTERSNSDPSHLANAQGQDGEKKEQRQQQQQIDSGQIGLG